ncbi:MAG: T9SS type A sorting domain-containing protein [Bacteroidia bacterium]|nr:T9SS type A sorting domain-containing protein [Bacteroidia bacterium]
MLRQLLLIIVTTFLSYLNVVGQEIQSNICEEVRFMENKGQVHDQYYKTRTDVLFAGRSSGMIFHLRNAGISYQLSRQDSTKISILGRDSVIKTTTIYRVDLEWIDALPQYELRTDSVLGAYDNFYLPNCPNGISHVRSYTGVRFQNLYQGISLHYYNHNGNLKCDYEVGSGANYRNIKIRVTGGQVVIKSDGSLRIITPLGEIEEGVPVVFQNGKVLKGQWIVSNNVLSFYVADYINGVAMTIDPLTRTWSTYYGGVGDDRGVCCRTDRSGSLLITGATIAASQTVFATSGAFQSSSYSVLDAFVSKFDNAGGRIWSTYYGEIGDDAGNGVTSDSWGNVYVVGATQGNNSAPPVFTTQGCHQDTLGGFYDGFVAKFDENGLRLWGTYYGGNIGENIKDCATDASGNLYFVGASPSSNGTSIATPGTHQPVYGGGSSDAFIVKFDSSGTRIWGTYFGGNGAETCFSLSIAFNSEIYICGMTSTLTSPAIATQGCYQSSSSGYDDCYLAKFDINGSRIWSTYYGSMHPDQARSCAVDPNSGSIYFVGKTFGNTGSAIATPGAHQTTYGGNIWDGFLAKFDSSGVREWGTYYGGGGIDDLLGCAVGSDGNVYIVGQTGSTDTGSIATSDGHQTVFGGNNWDGFLAAFNSSGVRLWGTYYGGGGYDYSNFVTVDQWGSVYMTGNTYTSQSNYFTTPGCFQPVNAGSSDAFIVKFNDCIPSTVSVFTNSDVTCNGGADGSAFAMASGGNGFTYYWYPIGGNSDTAFGLPAGNYTCVAVNNCGVGATQSVVITEPLAMITSVQTSIDSVCSGSTSVTLNASASGSFGPVSCYWFTTADTSSFLTIIPTSTVVEVVLFTDSLGCQVEDSVIVYVHPPCPVDLGQDTSVCGPTFLINSGVQGAGSYLWSDGSTGQLLSVDSTGLYIVTVVDSNQCTGTDSILVHMFDLPAIQFQIATDTMCTSDIPIQLIAIPNGGTYSGTGVSGAIFNPQSAGVGTHTVTYTFIDSNQCISTSDFNVVVDACAGVEDFISEEIVFFTTPDGCLLITTTLSVVEVFDVTGRVMLTDELNPGQNLLDMKNWAAGIYLVRITTTNHKEFIFKRCVY